MTAPFVSGTDGYNSFRIPSLVRASDGSLVALCEGRVGSPSDTGNIDIVSKRSTDNGETWGPLVVATSHGNNTAGNPCTIVDPESGDIVLVSCRNEQTATSEGIRTGVEPARRVYVQRSTTFGTSWTSPVEITSQVRLPWMRWYATGPGHGAVHTLSGRLVIPCNHSREPSGSDTGAERKYGGAHCIYSDDGGENWSIGFISSNSEARIIEDETTVCELNDGRLYFNCRCDEEDERVSNRADAYSTDEGESIEIQFFPQGCLVTPVVQGSVINTPYGLVFSSCSHPEGRAALALWTSVDDGQTWYLKKYITGRVSGYSDMVLKDSVTLAIVYETGRWNNYEKIEFATIYLTELF